ncbi:MAG: lytic transglycosylase domain-containing protein [Sphingobium sp.]|nr:lytic transglycosylase domain-containing protein [Sphingobium sp.]
MSAMGKDTRLSWRFPGLIAFAVLGTAATNASTPADDASAIRWEAAANRIDASGDADRRVASAIQNWRTLSATQGAGFATYADFLMQNSGWPDEAKLRGYAEKAVNPDLDSPAGITAFFAKYPALSAQGKAANAMALARLNRRDEAIAAARDAWGSGSLSILMEQALLAQFSANLTPEDHLRHADAVLWRRDTAAAERVFAYLPVTRQAVVAARIAFQRKAPDATLKMGAADPIGVMDAGYIADKVRWMAGNGDELGARRLLAERLPLAQTPADPEDWYEIMFARAKAAATDGDWKLAFAIASRVDDAFAPGTDISAQPVGVRDDYTNLTWLAGTAAFNRLSRPADAEGMFARYAGGGQNASVKAKGYYWAGRSALAAGRRDTANSYFAQAAAYPDQYYGQLALERLGRPVPLPGANAPQVTLTDSDRAAFNSQSVVQAAKMLGTQGAWGDQSKFVRAIAASAQTEPAHLFANELARTLGRPDLGIMAGRRATASGLSGYDKASFPHMKVPDSERDNWTMIHAISRQESQFDRAIVSYAGARGLMQLMPATAREQAGKLGMNFDQGNLFDPDFNVTLGSSYFVKLLSYYNGSYPLAVAAYNAGMGNVNKWIKANGDPRLPGGDIVQWIEDIPIYQTKDYVQRVLENAVVYDLMNPVRDSAPGVSAKPLSRYLGKSNPG